MAPNRNGPCSIEKCNRFVDTHCEISGHAPDLSDPPPKTRGHLDSGLFDTGNEHNTKITALVIT